MAHAALGDLDAAITALSGSLLEKQDPVVKRKLKASRHRREEQCAKEYEDDAPGEEAKLQGNVAFKAFDYPCAIERYTEAIGRARRNPMMYSNRAAAYSKLGELPMTIKDCDAARFHKLSNLASSRLQFCLYLSQVWLIIRRP
jgi:tetratricopeptide (TPR) repeat protein